VNLQSSFRLPSGLGRAEVDTILVQLRAFPADALPAKSWRIYDTFDWRLHANSMTLQWSGDELVLRSMSSGNALHRLPTASPPRFASDMPAGPFRTQLEAIIAPRALLELATVRTIPHMFRALNTEEKTIARLIVTEARPGTWDGGPAGAAGRHGADEPPRALFLTVLPLRGYTKQTEHLVDRLRPRLRLSATETDIHLWAVRSAGHKPGAYSNKLAVPMTPGMQAGEAMRLILLSLLETMRANEAGIKADIDSEFLHDYRVAVRRTRSALSQIRQVLPLARTAAFRQQFRDLGRLTGALRDLDVHLLAEADYRALVPDAMQEDISPLFDDLRSRRSQALAAVVAGLESDAHTTLLNEWEDFLREPHREGDADKTTMPIIDLARARLARQYRSIVREGNYIIQNTEDGLLHALRIECKQLRYLLEFFASLFPPKELSQAIGQLKRLQENLGEFVDSAVQRDYLLSVAETLNIDETRARRALVATGYLVETNERKGREAKGRFAGTFEEFTSRANQKAFNRLISDQRKGRR
jgi:CHAD domain-containing protein